MRGRVLCVLAGAEAQGGGVARLLSRVRLGRAAEGGRGARACVRVLSPHTQRRQTSPTRCRESYNISYFDFDFVFLSCSQRKSHVTHTERENHPLAGAGDTLTSSGLELRGPLVCSPSRSKPRTLSATPTGGARRTGTLFKKHVVGEGVLRPRGAAAGGRGRPSPPRHPARRERCE